MLRLIERAPAIMREGRAAYEALPRELPTVTAVSLAGAVLGGVVWAMSLYWGSKLRPLFYLGWAASAYLPIALHRILDRLRVRRSRWRLAVTALAAASTMIIGLFLEGVWLAWRDKAIGIGPASFAAAWTATAGQWSDIRVLLAFISIAVLMTAASTMAAPSGVGCTFEIRIEGAGPSLKSRPRYASCHARGGLPAPGTD